MASQAHGAACIGNPHEFRISVVMRRMARGTFHLAAEQRNGPGGVNITRRCGRYQVLVRSGQRGVVCEPNRVVAGQRAAKAHPVSRADEMRAGRDCSAIGKRVNGDGAIMAAQAQFGGRAGLGGRSLEGGAAVERVGGHGGGVVPQGGAGDALRQMRRVAELAGLRCAPALG